MTYRSFDTSRLHLYPLAVRHHDLALDAVLPLERSSDVHPTLRTIADRMLDARENGAAVVLMMGAHVLRAGVQRYLIDLLDRGMLSCIAMNGAGVIHDFEFALIGKTTESVRRYIEDGRFGLWKETGRINDIVRDAHRDGLGLGEAVGKAVREGGFPHGDISVLAAAHRAGIPATVHVGIGYDITHEHPNFDGAAYGAASYTDFLRFAAALERLERGVVMNFGSAVMAPEVFLKALAMVRNVAAQDGKSVRRFATLVCDLKNLPGDIRNEPSKDDPNYYYRPWKTMLSRTVAQGGESFYLRADHAESIPQLWTAVTEKDRG